MKQLSFLSMVLLTACVTINIYFPAAAAEKAADEIIKDIQTTLPEGDPTSELNDWQHTFYKSVDAVLSTFISSAHAQEANLSIDSPEIRKLTAQMQSRFSGLKSYYDAGLIGIATSGLLTVRDAASVPLKDRNQVNRLVAAENADRENLYKAIANANGHPEWATQIKSTFAARWVSNAKSGWWYQTANGSWKQK